MIILSADTSGDSFALALCENEDIIKAFRSVSLNSQSVDMLPEIDRLLASSGLRAEDVGLFCVGLGPGSFTGLRVGITIIKAMAFALKKPVAGVPSIDAIARNAVTPNPFICVIRDARQSKVYARFYKNTPAGPIALSRIMLLEIDKLPALIKSRTYFIGDAISIYREKMIKAGFAQEDLASPQAWQPDPGIIALLGLKRSRAGIVDNVFTLSPLYIYPKECQIRKQPVPNSPGPWFSKKT
ncbi:MAG: tRNA (adenosine(37)-N6)-threonylcarbamoyltransferase complex dimerization subunit type 1 TsaB [Candidatus Omnitrophica bacterium]|nr:tRNA (adenosine(37)-N6)-threonylcarbamoyltransferase complex dimerization subunit type 1 TsaB [Candidatus Omnitrophota bacterium]